LATPPGAKSVPKEITLHGDARVDNYFWLRDKQNPKVMEYLKAEDAYADAVMKPLAPTVKVAEAVVPLKSCCSLN